MRENISSLIFNQEELKKPNKSGVRRMKGNEETLMLVLRNNTKYCR